jgi:Flp pilus assembly pilin Flp
MLPDPRALEYGLITAGISIVAITALTGVFALFSSLFATAVANLTAAVN